MVIPEVFRKRGPEHSQVPRNPPGQFRHPLSVSGVGDVFTFAMADLKSRDLPSNGSKMAPAYKIIVSHVFEVTDEASLPR